MIVCRVFIVFSGVGEKKSVTRKRKRDCEAKKACLLSPNDFGSRRNKVSIVRQKNKRRSQKFWGQ